MMHWEIKRKISKRSETERKKQILGVLLKNRKVSGKKSLSIFFHPPEPERISLSDVKISKLHFQKSLRRIQTAIKKQESIIIYGDYDADGICSTAILWETLYAAGAKVLPFIPHREDHGYGLSIRGMEEIIEQSKQDSSRSIPSLIITVDNGIVANEAVDYANKLKIDVIICDHHEKPQRLPKAFAIIHTTQLAGSGVAWVFANHLLSKIKTKSKPPDSLDLATIGTVADMVPLIGPNRSIVKYGLKKLQTTNRIGLLSMLKEVGINPALIETNHISFIIAPRLNTMGRLEHAVDSLRLLCTPNWKSASKLTKKMGALNQRRQILTNEMLEKAKTIFLSDKRDIDQEKIIIIDHEEFHEGVIGLIAGKLVEEYYRPTIVVSRREIVSKASARSISGFNIIEAIRKTGDLFIDAGGHPMAAGFTIESSKIESMKTSLRKIAATTLTDEMLEKTLSIDCEIELADISWDLLWNIKELKPFGIGNPKPTFALKNAPIIDSMKIGKEGKHLKILLSSHINTQPTIPGLWFGNGELVSQISSKVSIAFTLDENIWRDKKELQLKIIDLKN